MPSRFQRLPLRFEPAQSVDQRLLQERHVLRDEEQAERQHPDAQNRQEAKKACGSALKELVVFDVYEGEKLQVGQKSVALRVTFQNIEAALTEADLLGLSQKVIEAAEKSVKATLR